MKIRLKSQTHKHHQMEDFFPGDALPHFLLVLRDLALVSEMRYAAVQKAQSFEVLDWI